jgi:hypothetical protein
MMNNDELTKYRLECLKMAYEFNFKIGNLKMPYIKEEEIIEDLRDIFSVADMNMEFILKGSNSIFPNIEE